MFKRVLLSSAAALLVGMISSAHAADLDNIIYSPNLPETQPVEIGNGWYLRGDLGYSFKTSGAANSYRVFTAGPPASYSTNAFTSSSQKSEFSGGLGMGYNFTDYFRADATFDFMRGRFNGTTTSATACPGMPAGTTCASNDRASFSAYSLMANGYVDLGTYAGFTPYVGAGAGMTQVRWDALTNSSYCVDGGAVCPTPATVAPVQHPGVNSWRFTYALMAGMSYNISNNLKLDVGYRYQKVGSGGMFGFDSASAGAGATGNQASDRGIAKHEIRAGLRYSLW